MPFNSQASVFGCCYLLSVPMSVRCTSSSLSICFQPYSQMIIHLVTLDSSRQPQGLRLSTKGHINAHFSLLLSSFSSSYPLSRAITLSVMFTITHMLVNYKSPALLTF
ncbi:hypothetical protein XENOCAPTIV_004509 [Xenoophorus captivus]|uniref:Uncharacterized protein n=1 Tax=Xenoophorus captivus TaxID=1517983 RepID=A0ABV0R6V4_9TELE